ncbi:DNA replication protein [Paraliobacillus quinghaiensis]|uniref:DNA replication protein n=1 Tax=Paraliobacillus quinghaiensis TaxID=470815 RepID=A0A917TH04_9BACI|nr:DnaD domain-containing protein [Paraliobacillus quinghaiensis]GGM23081.1 DNA replication protein [Paraliobacillus quinghaiensis]
MTENHPYQAFLKDQLTIPTKLLTEYHTHDLTEKEVVVILQLHRFSLIGIYLPTPDEIASYVSFDQQECAMILRRLMQKNMLSIEQDQAEQAMVDEHYSLEPLWNLLYKPQKPKQENPDSEQAMNIFILFEQEFGRPLSPFEIETINIWIDEEEQKPALIKAALREAVLMSKLNFKYIDRILREWKKKGIRSVEQARTHSKSFHNHQSNQEVKQDQPKRDVSLYYNWLEEE